MPLIAGIDCGSNGAIAILRQDGSLVTVADMPYVMVKIGKTERKRVDPDGVARLLEATGVSCVAIEAVHAMPTNGSLGNFVLGHAFGLIEGVVSTLSIPRTLVTPATWKRAMGVTSDKKSSLEMARSIWPLTDRFKRAKDDGRAEAALIALWHLKQGNI